MRILVPVIVGGIIGYFTNWLAIKMLFRPHYEKRIMGVKIPFTPGLIPKERDRIAKSIGETVGVYLLSPETIVEALSNKKTDREIKLWLEHKIINLKENQQSIKELLVNLLNENYQKFINSTKEGLKNIIISQIRGEEFKSIIFKAFENKVNNFDTENIYGLIDEKLRGFLFELSSSPQLKNKINNYMKLKLSKFTQDERQLSELIPKDILSVVSQYIDENENHIGNSIIESFKDPTIQQKLKSSISDLVYQNVNKLITAFISPDLISEKIFHMIEKYINSEDANKNIVMLIKSSIDKLLKAKVSEITPRLMDIIGEEGFERGSDLIIKNILDEENYNILFEIIEEKLRGSEIDSKEKVINYLKTNVEQILDSAELEANIISFIDNTVDELLSKPISSLAEKIDQDIIGMIYNLFRNAFNNFAIHELPSIIEFFNVSKIVEDKVNSFDVDFAEELILEIANKELKAITRLGALLGGILGLLSPLIQMLY